MLPPHLFEVIGVYPKFGRNPSSAVMIAFSRNLAALATVPAIACSTFRAGHRRVIAHSSA
jgi:hypothetical protein